MRNVIRADLGRTFRKKSFYVFIALTLIYLDSTILFVISIPVFLGVYSDDFKSGS
ncbi:MAG: hypothetical protein K6E27_09330 [Eubacterium sp.]|nr:hypothetical protein [Eubacterium sp.]